MISATGVWDACGFPYALDNGAWTAHSQRQPWDAERFARLVYRYGAAADFVVAPDVVGDRDRTLEIAHEWLPRLRWVPRLLWAAQDGMTPADVPAGLGVFVGGSDAYKESSLPMWGRWRADGGPYLHVGRVNTARRILLCRQAGADSCDGTSATMFAETIGELDRASRRAFQSTLGFV
jgi:hypothetical protein